MTNGSKGMKRKRIGQNNTCQPWKHVHWKSVQNQKKFHFWSKCNQFKRPIAFFLILLTISNLLTKAKLLTMLKINKMLCKYEENSTIFWLFDLVIVAFYFDYCYVACKRAFGFYLCINFLFQFIYLTHPGEWYSIVCGITQWNREKRDPISIATIQKNQFSTIFFLLFPHSWMNRMQIPHYICRHQVQIHIVI